MANFTTITNAKWIPAQWKTEVKASHVANKHMAKLVKNIPHGKKKGDTIYLPIPGRATAAAKAASTDVTFSTDTATQFELNINRHYYAAIAIEDIAEVLSQPGMSQYYTGDLGEALAQELDVYLHSLGANFGGGSSTAGSSYSKAYVGDGTSALTLWDGSDNTNTGNGVAFADYILRGALQKLEDANVRKQLTLVLPPVVKNAMLGVDRYVSSDFVAGKPVISGEFGSVYGVRLAVSTNCATVQADDSTTNYRAALLFTEEAIRYAEPKKMELWTDKSVRSLTHEIVAHHIYGAKVYRAEDGIALIFPA